MVLYISTVILYMEPKLKLIKVTMRLVASFFFGFLKYLDKYSSIALVIMIPGDHKRSRSGETVVTQLTKTYCSGAQKAI